MSRPRAAWVVMGPPPYFATCKNCGAHPPAPEMPLPISALTKYIDYVLEAHKSCPPPAAT